MTYEIKIVPLSQRQTLIQQRLENPIGDGETIYDFRGGTITPKVISLEIDVPVYRMANLRTFTEQQSEIAIKGLEKSYFAKGQELSTIQADQHRILLNLARRGSSSVTPIIDVLRQEGQRKPILITSTGTVVNGNRRMSAMRELYRATDGSVDNRFSHVQCAVLPSDTTPDEIDDIEADLQARLQTKLDYDWIGDAELLRRQVNKGRTTKEVADRLRRSRPELENALQAIDEADLYLTEWAEKPRQYDLVSGDAEQIFRDIPKRIANMNTQLQNASRVIAWSLFENRDRLPGRVYAFNSAFGKLAPQVLEVLSEQLDIEDTNTSSAEDVDDDFSIDIDEDDAAPNYAPIVEALRNEVTKEDAITALIEACETAIERDKGQKSEKAALRALSQANAKLTGIDVISAGEGTLPAMEKQIDSIRNVLAKIEDRINQRRKGITDSTGSDT